MEQKVQVGYGGSAALLEEMELTQYADEIGAMVLQAAVLRFLTENDTEADAFLEWVDAQHAAADFVPQLMTAFPQFAEILNDEVEAMAAQAEVTAPATE